jgi:hypothetical protein
LLIQAYSSPQGDSEPWANVEIRLREVNMVYAVRRYSYFTKLFSSAVLLYIVFLILAAATPTTTAAAVFDQR